MTMTENQQDNSVGTSRTVSSPPKKDFYSIYGATRFTGVKTDIIKAGIERGKITEHDGYISNSIVQTIQEQKVCIIGICDYMAMHDSKLFNSKLVKNRRKFLDYLEENDFFGVEQISSEEILYKKPEKEPFYIIRNDINILDEKTELFFSEFGLTEQEKVIHIINASRNHQKSKEYLCAYIKQLDSNNIFTPVFTEFIHIVLNSPDIIDATDNDIIVMVSKTNAIATKKWLINFTQFVGKKTRVNYHDVNQKPREKNKEVKAYPYRIFAGLAKCLFNEDYIYENKMVEQALSNHIYAEMWLYLSAHYVCGWRSADICNNWIYLNLDKRNRKFSEINTETLYCDILNNNISEEVYSSVATYVIESIILANNYPSKTAQYEASVLRVNITKSLKPFFGRLILIAEAQHLNSGEGYIQAKRRATYTNWVNVREFFGEDVYQLFERSNIKSCKLNKSYLQSIEEAAAKNGYGSLVAHRIAALARNHKNIDTTAVYLADHNLSGETAEVVLSMMFERGVFGVILYKALIAAYPEAFSNLPVRAQTKIMKSMDLSAYEMEVSGSGTIANTIIEDSFKSGLISEPYKILKAMYSIGQGFGKSKDSGIYCLKRALGEVCKNPQYESCIANNCPYHVFTTHGLMPLLNVIREYQDKYIESGNLKYKTVLQKVIIPNFQMILNKILREMTKEENTSIQKLIREVMNE